jgi:hypothetical protein
MKYLFSLLLILCLIACEGTENLVVSNLTGEKESYTMYQGSDYNISGKSTLSETKDNGTLVVIELDGTEKGLLHPTHLHFGNIAGNGEIAAVLNPTEGDTGKSSTTVNLIDNSTKITYAELLEMELSIKIHLSDTEPGKHTILAGGNIGTASTKSDPFGRVEITVCKSN